MHKNFPSIFQSMISYILIQIRHIGISFPQWLVESDYHEDGRVDETEDAKKSHSAVKVNRPEIFELNP